MSDGKSIEAIIAKYLSAQESGQSMDRQALLTEYPDFAAELNAFLEDHHRYEHAVMRVRQGIHADSNNLESEKPTSVERNIAQRAAQLEVTQHYSHNFQSVERNIAQRAAQGSTPWSITNLDSIEFPAQFGNYQLLAEIDRGGMGIIYRARDDSLGRIVAMKVIRTGEFASREEIQRFKAEAESAATLAHPNIVPVYEVGEYRGLLYFTMAFIDGENLADAIRHREFPPQECARLVYKIAGAVKCAHNRGIIHRDLKPSNVLLDKDGEPFLADFGLALQVSAERNLTATGQILGTPAYMPPEQISGKTFSRSPGVDIYSLGAVLYSLCTRLPPFSGPTPFDILMQLLDRDPPAPSKINKRIPRSLERICTHAMAKSPEERYTSVGEMADDLQRFLKDEPIQLSKESIAQRLGAWWRREPMLVSHLCGIGITLMIVLVSILVRRADLSVYLLRIMLLAVWMLLCFPMQRWVFVPRWKDTACLTWAAVDVFLYTTVIFLADPPRGLLLIGYPMMIGASGLFYRNKFVIFMTTACLLGFMILCQVTDDATFSRVEFSAIYAVGLAVLGLCLTSMIRRVRGLSRFYEGAE